MRKIVFQVVLFLGFVLPSEAQIGGEQTFRFLSLTNSARLASMGGGHVALGDSSDLNMPFHNPALLRNDMTRQVLVSYVNYLADIHYGYASHAWSLSRYGTFAAGMHYINYGRFSETLPDGTFSGGEFQAAEYALNLIWSHHYRRLQYGLNIKPVLSSFERYQSAGVAFDAGVLWSSRNGLTRLGMSARNFGYQLTTYYSEGVREVLPFDLQAGIAHRLAQVPLVLSVTAHNLNNWELSKPDEALAAGSFFPPSEGYGRQLMRHLLAGVEFMPSPNFTVRGGYNYHLRQELKHSERLSTVGLSAGFGVRIKRFRFDYATTRYHIAGTSSHFTLAFSINNPRF